MTPSDILAAAGAPTWEEIQTASHVLRMAEQAMRNRVGTFAGQGYYIQAWETLHAMADCGLSLDTVAGYVTLVAAQ